MKVITNNVTTNINNPFKSIVDSVQERYDVVLLKLSTTLNLDLRLLKTHYKGGFKTFDISLAVCISETLNALYKGKMIKEIDLKSWGSANVERKAKIAKDYTKLFMSANAIG